MSRQVLSQGFVEFRDLITQHFRDLIDNYGFKIIHEEDVSGEHGLIVLESADCRLRFIYDRGAVEPDIGSLDARIGWTHGPAGADDWFDVYTVTEFVEGRKPSAEEISTHGRALFSMSTDERIADLASSLRPVAEHVFRLFRKDTPPEKQRELLAYYSG